jgi:hypothetical protein
VTKGIGTPRIVMAMLKEKIIANVDELLTSWSQCTVHSFQPPIFWDRHHLVTLNVRMISFTDTLVKVTCPLIRDWVASDATRSFTTIETVIDHLYGSVPYHCLKCKLQDVGRWIWSATRVLSGRPNYRFSTADSGLAVVVILKYMSVCICSVTILYTFDTQRKSSQPTTWTNRRTV